MRPDSAKFPALIAICPNVEKYLPREFYAFQPKSLQDQCMRTIRKDLKTFLYLRQNQLPNLPYSLRNDIVEFFLKYEYGIKLDVSVWDCHKLIHALINPSTAVLNFKNWNYEMWTDYDDRLEFSMEHLSTNAPNLKHLSIGATRFDLSVVAKPSISLMQPMLNLKYLAITTVWCWADCDLELIPEKFPNLVSLKIALTNVTADGVAHLAKLQYLREFRFYVRAVHLEDAHTATQTLYNLCVQNMPQLRVLGNKTEEYHVEQDFCFNSSLLEISPDFCGTFALEHLHSKYDLPARAKLPNLTNLHFTGPITKVRTSSTLASYKALTSLTISFLTNDEVEEFLLQIGHQLTELHLEFLKDALDIFMVLYFCPNLEKFTMYECVDGILEQYPIFRTKKVTKHNFRRLKEFNAMFSREMPPGLFKLLLEAPMLRKLSLHIILLQKADFECVQQLSSTSLLSLENFGLYSILNGDEAIESVADLYKYVLRNAPNICRARISWDNDDVFDMFYDQKYDLYKVLCYLGEC